VTRLTNRLARRDFPTLLAGLAWAFVVISAVDTKVVCVVCGRCRAALKVRPSTAAHRSPQERCHHGGIPELGLRGAGAYAVMRSAHTLSSQAEGVVARPHDSAVRLQLSRA